MRLFENKDIGLGMESSCCSLSDVEDAKQVCYRLGLSTSFYRGVRRRVMRPFAEECLQGNTPNPCINCNRARNSESVGRNWIAGTLPQDTMPELSVRMLACRLKKALIPNLFSHNLTQQQMAHFLLPLGGLTKAEVREQAAAHGFVNARKKDSQDILCPEWGLWLPLSASLSPCASASILIGRSCIITGHRPYPLHAGSAKGLNIALGNGPMLSKKNVADNQTWGKIGTYTEWT